VSSLAARRKQRDYRKRRACGAAVLKIELPLYPLIDAGSPRSKPGVDFFDEPGLDPHVDICCFPFHAGKSGAR